MDYNVIWYLLVGVLLIGYAILDGFDLGVGILHLFAKGNTNRRLMINAIGPVWDGNEVWLITAGGALFAAFPHVYATSFSAFYLPFMALLFALIFRAVSMEFRGKEDKTWWRNMWDISFFAGSLLASLLFGVAIGNVVLGFAIGADKEFTGGFFDLLTPYTLLAGAFSVSMFALHGAIYLNLKTEGALQEAARKWAKNAYILFVLLFASVTVYTLVLKPEMIANFSFGKVAAPWETHQLVNDHQTAISVFAWLVVVLNVLSILNIPRTLVKGKELQAFVSSALSIGAIVGLFALGIFPNMMISSTDPAYNLDIYNSASSQSTLKTMFTISLFGLPFVLAYTGIIYWTYRGKVKLTEHSY
ncbi:cytochrome d ubiquinol oxidase subunit II [bacterium]|nr:cytochrome d ubiquinol oxidase subunit II [bacterium]